MWNRWPVQVQCMKQSTQSRCTGTTQKDGMEREVEGSLGWGTHVHPWLIHVNIWQKPPQYCKVIRLQLKKKKEFWLSKAAFWSTWGIIPSKYVLLYGWIYELGLQEWIQLWHTNPVLHTATLFPSLSRKLCREKIHGISYEGSSCGSLVTGTLPFGGMLGHPQEPDSLIILRLSHWVFPWGAATHVQALLMKGVLSQSLVWLTRGK